MARDPVAANEMVRRSGQTGVPVIFVDDQVIVGFNRPRLEHLLSTSGPRPASGRPGIGLRVADAHKMGQKVPWLAGRSGAYVGGVAAGSPGAAAGVQTGDLVTAVDGQPVSGAADLERAVASGRRRLVLTVVNHAGMRQVPVSLS